MVVAKATLSELVSDCSESHFVSLAAFFASLGWLQLALLASSLGEPMLSEKSSEDCPPSACTYVGGVKTRQVQRQMIAMAMESRLAFISCMVLIPEGLRREVGACHCSAKRKRR